MEKGNYAWVCNYNKEYYYHENGKLSATRTTGGSGDMVIIKTYDENGMALNKKTYDKDGNVTSFLSTNGYNVDMTYGKDGNMVSYKEGRDYSKERVENIFGKSKLK